MCAACDAGCNRGVGLTIADMATHRSLGLVTLLVALCALGACVFKPHLDPQDAPAVSAMAHALMDSGKTGDVPPSEWPAGVVDLVGPKAIWVRPEGVYMITSSFFVEERGLFVPREPSKVVASPGTDPSYEPVALDVFTYYVAG